VSIIRVAAALARAKGVSTADLATATTDNFFRLFKKAPRAALAASAAA
jgi:TatD DNase family protein